MLENKKHQSKNKIDKFKEKTINVGKILIRSATKIIVKAGTAGAMEAADFKISGLDDEASSLVDKHLGEMLTKQKENKASIESFKASLEELPALLSKQDNADQEHQKPLIFIIDELDRCRPDFALKVLERMKHFFQVKGVHFVLGVNIKQVQNSVSSIYGAGIDANLYLQKFIHMTITIPDYVIGRERYSDRSISGNYLQKLYKDFGFASLNNRDCDLAIEFVKEIVMFKQCSLRQIERIFSLLSISFNLTPQNRLKLAPIVGGLCVLKIFDPELFEKAKSKQLSFSEVKDHFGFNREFVGEIPERVQWASDCWSYCLDPDAKKAVIASWDSSMSRYMYRNRFEIVPDLAINVVDCISIGLPQVEA